MEGEIQHGNDQVRRVGNEAMAALHLKGNQLHTVPQIF